MIPPELRRIVEFLNKQMDPAQVLAVEIRQYAGQGLTTLLPRVFGQTSQTEQKKAAASPRGRRWDEESFFAKLAERGIEHDVRLARKLFDWATEHTTRVDFGSGVKSASFIPVLEFGDGSWFGPFRVFSGYTGAYIEVPLGGAGMRAAPFDDPDMKRELVRRLNAIRGVQIAEELGRFPSIYPQSLADESAAVQFLAVMEWAVGAVKAASVSPGES